MSYLTYHRRRLRHTTKYIFLEIHVSLYLLLYLDTLVKRDLIFPSFLSRMKFLK